MRAVALVLGLCHVAVPATATVFCSIHERIDKVGDDGEGVLHVCARGCGCACEHDLHSALGNDCAVAKPS
jgi:hypothetical protein